MLYAQRLFGTLRLPPLLLHAKACPTTVRSWPTAVYKHGIPQCSQLQTNVNQAVTLQDAWGAVSGLVPALVTSPPQVETKITPAGGISHPLSGGQTYKQPPQAKCGQPPQPDDSVLKGWRRRAPHRLLGLRGVSKSHAGRRVTGVSDANCA